VKRARAEALSGAPFFRLGPALLSHWSRLLRAPERACTRPPCHTAATRVSDPHLSKNKTRIHVQVWKTYLGRNRGVGTWHAVSDIHKTGGLPAFWAGTSAKMFESASKGLVLMWAKESLLSAFSKTDTFGPGEWGGSLVLCLPPLHSRTRKNKETKKDGDDETT